MCFTGIKPVSYLSCVFHFSKIKAATTEFFSSLSMELIFTGSDHVSYL